MAGYGRIFHGEHRVQHVVRQGSARPVIPPRGDRLRHVQDADAPGVLREPVSQRNRLERPAVAGNLDLAAEAVGVRNHQRSFRAVDDDRMQGVGEDVEARRDLTDRSAFEVQNADQVRRRLYRNHRAEEGLTCDGPGRKGRAYGTGDAANRPDQVDQGAKKPKTLDWIISRVKDGQGVTAPREVIHLINEAKTEQIKKLQLGEDDLTDENIIGRSAIKSALESVSKVRLEQTIYAEFPSLTPYIQQLENEKAEQTIETLSNIWQKGEPETQQIAKELHFIGFFEERGTKQEPRYWIPFMYRSVLNITQGAADQNLE